MPRYFEIIITGRQLAALVSVVALAIAAAFGLGVGVRMLQPAPSPPHEVIAGPAAVPTPVWQPSPPMLPTAEPTAAPVATAAPTNAPVPTATEPPRATPTPGAVVARSGRWVQVVALRFRQQAEGVRNRVVALGYTPRQVVVLPATGGKFRVRVGPFPDVESADRVAARLRAEGFGGSFVVKPGE